MNRAALQSPVFFIGMPRSGTTVLFEAFAWHPQVAWISSYCRQYPRQTWINGLRALLDNRFVQLRGNKKQYAGAPAAIFNLWLPQPDEAYEFWEAWTGVPFARDALLEVRADELAAAQTRKAVAAIAGWQGRPRVAAKLTGPPRIAFLRDLFPDARFVHIVRDGRAVVHSLLKVPFWKANGGFDGPFWSNVLTESDLASWEASGCNPAVLAALQWQRIVALARTEAGALPEGAYVEMRYEEYIAAPHASLQALLDFAHLSDARAVHAHLERQPPIGGMNRKYESDFSADELARIEDCLQPGLRAYGYE